MIRVEIGVVGQGQDLTRLGVHYHNGGRLAAVFLEGLFQLDLCDMLDSLIQRGDDVQSVHAGLHGLVVGQDQTAPCVPLGHDESFFSGQISVVGTFQPAQSLVVDTGETQHVGGHLMVGIKAPFLSRSLDALEFQAFHRL